MRKRGLLFVGGVLLMSGAATAQVPGLPAGPNRDVVSRKCQGCHDLSVVVEAAGQSREDWNTTIEEMVTSNGMNITLEERTKILDYLSSYLGPPTPNPTAK